MADTQFLIDIAAEIAGADDAVTELVRMAKELEGIGSELDAFDAAIAQASDALTEAEIATKTTKEALKLAQKEYAALSRAAAKGSVEAAAALEAQAAKVLQLKSASTQAAQEQKRLASSLKTLRSAAKEAKSLNDAAEAAARGTREFGPMASALGALGGPLGSAGQKAAELGDAFVNLGSTLGGAGGPIALAVVAASVYAALAAAIVAATAAATAWVVKMADSARTTALNVAALEAQHPRLEGLNKLLPDLRRNTGLATQEILGLAKQLDAAKVPADDLPLALEKIGQAKMAGADVTEFVKALKTGKKTAAEVAALIDTKYGGIVHKRLLGLDKQSERLSRNIAGLGKDVEIEPLLEALSTLVDLFDENTAAGKTIKFLLEAIFQPVINAATKAIPVIEAFFLGMLIGAVKIYTAFKPLIRVLGDVFGFDDATLGDTLQVAAGLGKAFAYAIGAAAAVFAAAMTQMALLIGVPIAGFTLLVTAAQAAWDGIKSAAESVLDFLSGISLAEVGTAMIEGLAGGITAAASLVVDAMGGVVQGAINSAKSLLGIASPSKVFEGLGEMTGEGFSGGVEGASGKAQTALESMVAPPRVDGAPAAAAASGPSNNFAGATFIINGVKDADDLEARLTRIFEGDLSQLSPEGAPAT